MNLKQLRKKTNLTQNEVAKLSGLTIRFISDIENGRRNPSDNSKKKLAKIYKVPVVEIFLACQRTNCSKQKEAI